MSLALAVCGCARDVPAAGDAPAKTSPTNKPVPVKTVAVTAEDVRRTSTQPATVHAYYRAEVRARVSGYVQLIKADIGDYVKAGATLAIVAVPELEKQQKIIEARITRYEAEETRAVAGVALAKAGVQSAQAKLAQARSETKQAQASLAAAEAEFARTRDLVDRQSLQPRVLDEVRKKRDSELANRDALESAINSAEAEVTVAQARQTSAEADLKAAQAETEIARRQLEELDVHVGYATLTAPFAGIVTRRAVDPGDLVRSASEVGDGEPLFVVSQIEKVRVQIPVPEVDAALVSRGDSMALGFPAFPAENVITAEVTRVSSDLDPSTRTMLVEAELDNPDRKLLPGMFGQATITLSTKVAANMLPARAVRFDETGQAYVYLLGADDTVSVVPVTTGIDNGHSLEVLTGVQRGQLVVDAHLKRFTNGDQVAPLDK